MPCVLPPSFTSPYTYLRGIHSPLSVSISARWKKPEVTSPFRSLSLSASREIPLGLFKRPQSMPRPTFQYLVQSFIQTRHPLLPAHLSPTFAFRGSIPSSLLPTRDAYLSYRQDVLKAFPDWINNPTEVVLSASPVDLSNPDSPVKESAIARMVWTGTNTGDGGVLGEGHLATGKRVSYRGIVWLERNAGDEGLSGGEVYGDLASFHRQLAGLETVSDGAWDGARKVMLALEVDEAAMK
jgi:hypothetical protein